jgi:hypothetical protein
VPSDGFDRVGYDEVVRAFSGETISRDGLTLHVTNVNSADKGFFLDVEVEDDE